MIFPRPIGGELPGVSDRKWRSRNSDQRLGTTLVRDRADRGTPAERQPAVVILIAGHHPTAIESICESDRCPAIPGVCGRGLPVGASSDSVWGVSRSILRWRRRPCRCPTRIAFRQAGRELDHRLSERLHVRPRSGWLAGLARALSHLLPWHECRRDSEKSRRQER